MSGNGTRGYGEGGIICRSGIKRNRKTPEIRPVASAEEVLQIVTAYSEWRKNRVGEEPTLPKWQYAIDESWLIGGWTQEKLTDKKTGASYWQLQEDEPIDVSVRFNKFPESLRTYSSANYKATENNPSDIGYPEISLTITVGTDGVTDAAVVIPLNCETGHGDNGANTSEFFSYSESDFIPTQKLLTVCPLSRTFLPVLKRL